jgi:hypothetical protein
MDGERTIQIFLESEIVKKQPPKPIGARYKITGGLSVERSDDGIGDSTVEVDGRILLNFQNEAGGFVKSFDLASFSNLDATAGDSIQFPEYRFDIFNEEKASTFSLSGHFDDLDTSSQDDVMWDGSFCPAQKLPSAVGAAKQARGICKGAGGGEGLDVYYSVKKVEDLYSK